MWLLIDFFLAFSQLLFWFPMKTAFFTTAPSNCNELWDWLNTDDEICIEFLKFLLYLYLFAYGQNRLLIIFSFWFKFELPTIYLKLWVGQWIKQPKNHMHLYLLGGYLIASFKVNEFQVYSLDWNIPVSTPNELYCSNIWSMAGIMVNRPDQINYPQDMTE